MRREAHLGVTIPEKILEQFAKEHLMRGPSADSAIPVRSFLKIVEIEFLNFFQIISSNDANLN